MGQDAESFRELAVESTIINIASESASIDRDSLKTRAAELLRLSNQQRSIIDSAVDRLIQRKDLTGKGKVLKLNDELAEASATMRKLRIAEEKDLRKAVGDKLKEVAKNIDEDHVSSLMDGIGALLIEYAKDTVAALEVDKEESLLRDAIKRRLRHLHETLDSIGMPDDARRTELLSRITEIAANSELGRHLFAGELFLGLSSVDTPGLIRAFGARTGIHVILDASVAIPMLCTLLYRAINNRFSIASRHVYDQLTNHGQPLLLPIDYLEEVATHLLRSFTDYQSIADIDPDLISSENSFISHYVGMRNEGDDIGFLEFLDSLGLNDSLRKSEFYSARDTLKNILQRLFDRYNIKVTPLGRASQQSFKRAQEGIAFAINKFGRERPRVLMQHDARTIAYLHDRDRSNDEADVLCTWDGVHFWMRERETADWLVMNPAVLGDVFAIARSSDYEGRLFTPVVLSMQLSEEAAEKGASVWDAIVKLERGSTSDAKLIESAKEFKKKYIEDKHSDYSSQDITKQWKKWKTENFANKAN